MRKKFMVKASKSHKMFFGKYNVNQFLAMSQISLIFYQLMLVFFKISMIIGTLAIGIKQ